MAMLECLGHLIDSDCREVQIERCQILLSFFNAFLFFIWYKCNDIMALNFGLFIPKNHLRMKRYQMRLLYYMAFSIK